MLAVESTKTNLGQLSAAFELGPVNRSREIQILSDRVRYIIATGQEVVEITTNKTYLGATLDFAETLLLMIDKANEAVAEGAPLLVQRLTQFAPRLLTSYYRTAQTVERCLAAFREQTVRFIENEKATPHREWIPKLFEGMDEVQAVAMDLLNPDIDLVVVMTSRPPAAMERIGEIEEEIRKRFPEISVTTRGNHQHLPLGELVAGEIFLQR